MNTNLEQVPSAHYLSLYTCTVTHKACTQALVTGNGHMRT